MLINEGERTDIWNGISKVLLASLLNPARPNFAFEEYGRAATGLERLNTNERIKTIANWLLRPQTDPIVTGVHSYSRGVNSQKMLLEGNRTGRESAQKNINVTLASHKLGHSDTFLIPV